MSESFFTPKFLAAAKLNTSMDAIEATARKRCAELGIPPLPSFPRHAVAEETVKFRVPLLPPSVNHYKLPNAGGGYRRTAEANGFRDAVIIFARQADCCRELQGPLEVTVNVYLDSESYGRSDVDNFGKCCLDALQAARVMSNDNQVKRLVIEKFIARRADSGFTDFFVVKLS